MLTQTAMDVISEVEKSIEKFESSLTAADFYVRQEYNIGRYKLDTTVSALQWDYYSRANYIWAG